jgi:AGZA family xanthine/uracil permease-like MFS transporter
MNRLVKGKAREVHPLLWVVTALFVIYFAAGPIKILFSLT